MKKRKIKSIVRDISYKASKRLILFRSLTPKTKLCIFKELSKHIQKSLIMELTDGEIISILERMDPSEAADILRMLPKAKQKKLMEEINDQMSSNINMLLSFEPNTAAHLMSLDYILVEEQESIRTIFKKINIHEKRTGKFPIVLIAKDNKLLGFIPGYKLGLAKLNEKAGRYVKKIATLSYKTDEKKVLRFFMKNPHAKVVVLGESKNVLGIIFSDDIIRLLRKQESASLYNFAGVSDEESIYDSVNRKVQSRYKWLILNLGTAFLAAITVSFFESTIARNVLLAIYMPIVAGMGGVMLVPKLWR
jgi:magnesium transporter